MSMGCALWTVAASACVEEHRAEEDAGFMDASDESRDAEARVCNLDDAGVCHTTADASCIALTARRYDADSGCIVAFVPLVCEPLPFGGPPRSIAISESSTG